MKNGMEKNAFLKNLLENVSKLAIQILVLKIKVLGMTPNKLVTKNQINGKILGLVQRLVFMINHIMDVSNFSEIIFLINVFFPIKIIKIVKAIK